MELSDIRKVYLSKKRDIKRRLREFRRALDKKGDIGLFGELAFCILTPQSKARACWDAVTSLAKKGLLCKGGEKAVLAELKGVRFKYKKAKYLCQARSTVSVGDRLAIRSVIGKDPDVFQIRDWLVKNIKGLGYKEASHFLRNIGLGDNIAILDRHILRNLKRLKVINKVPDALSRKRYLEIEQKMVKFAKRIGIPASDLDLVLWCKETGEVFK